MASFAPLSQRTLPEAAALHWRACNPAMDLVLVTGRLWRMVDASSAGSAKVWEHPAENELSVEWAPDGKHFVQLKSNSTISVCSVHTGISTEPPVSLSFTCSPSTMLRWGQAPSINESLDDVIFARLNESIPQPLPLSKPETSSISTASALFARQNAQSKPSKTLKRPQIPALTPDIPYNSLLVVINRSEAYIFLGGSLPLGKLTLSSTSTISGASVYPFEQAQLTLFTHDNATSHLKYHIHPIDISNPSLSKFSRASTRLQFYLNHCFESLEVSVSSRRDGLAARDEFIAKWSQNAFQSHPTPEKAVFAEMLMLLLTGKPSESFQVHFSTKLAERGLNKWNESMSQSLTSLRKTLIDYVIPSLENIAVWLKQTRAWISCIEGFSTETNASQRLESAISLALKALVCASDASLQARLELGSLENFTRWLRYEIQKSSEEQRNSDQDLAKPNIDVYRAIQFVEKHLKNPLLDDLLEAEKVILPDVINNVDGDGLVSNEASKEYLNLIAEKKMEKTENSIRKDESNVLVSMSMDDDDMSSMDTIELPPNLSKARYTQREDNPNQSLSSERLKGLILLLDDLAMLLKDVFGGITKELMRCITFGPIYDLGLSSKPCISRDYASKEVQYLAFTTEEINAKFINMIRVQNASPEKTMAMAIDLRLDTSEEYVKLLDFGLFDDTELGILYKFKGEHFLSTVNLSTFDWNPTHPDKQLISSVNLMRLNRSHSLGPLFTPKYLALNGRQGRRVGCVLGSDGRSMQVFDMETDVDEEDGAEDDHIQVD